MYVPSQINAYMHTYLFVYLVVHHQITYILATFVYANVGWKSAYGLPDMEIRGIRGFIHSYLPACQLFQRDEELHGEYYSHTHFHLAHLRTCFLVSLVGGTGDISSTLFFRGGTGDVSSTGLSGGS